MRTFRFDDLPTMSRTVDLRNPPLAILVTVGDDRRATGRVLGELRVRTDLLAYAPVLVVDYGATRPDAWAWSGVDQVFTSPPDDAALEAWTIEPNVAVPRLVEQFGQGSIVPLLERFRESLLAVRGDFADGEAHQVAGLAGTLGYSALGRACEALPEHPALIGTALREVRKAIYDMSQHLQRYAAL